MRSAAFRTSFAAVDGEAAPLTHEGLAESGSSAQHLAGVGAAGSGRGTLQEAAGRSRG